MVRLLKADIINFRNVQSGSIDFPYSSKNSENIVGADITGIYGQNGSGKTTFIAMLTLLKSMLSGENIKDSISSLITAGESSSCFSVQFLIKHPTAGQHKVIYTANFIKENAPQEITIQETLKASSYSESKNSYLKVVLETSSSQSDTLLRPKARQKELFATDSKTTDKLRAYKIICEKDCRSYLFSPELLEEINLDSLYATLFFELRLFAQRDLFVINNHDIGLINLDVALPMNFRLLDTSDIDQRSITRAGQIPLPLDRPTLIPQELLALAEQLISTINFVLCKLIPGLTISLHRLTTELTSNGTEGTTVQLVASRENGATIPLKFESDGIKKIISILHLLIAVHNNPSITVAIDELDAGIYEYLLGELLGILKKSGQGQLIFTAHSLRPLEVLSSENIVFTTTNPNNRYVKRTIKPSNNLRLVYLRDIVLGSDGEELYEDTDSIEIAHAMRLLAQEES